MNYYLIKQLLQIDCDKRIEWEDFCKHKWFRLFDELSDSDLSESDLTDSDIETIFNESKDSIDTYNKLSTDTKKFDDVSCIENYVDSVSLLIKSDPIISTTTNTNDYYLKSSQETKEKDFVMVNRLQQNKTKTYKEKESLGGSIINIMSESVNFVFNLPKSY
jgi:hypothetical protein